MTPVARQQAEQMLEGIEFADDAYAAAAEADALVIVTEWDDFARSTLTSGAFDARQAPIDLRNVYDRAEAEEDGPGLFRCRTRARSFPLRNIPFRTQVASETTDARIGVVQ